MLRKFIANRDEAAFATLVQRHGGMVLSICRNVLRQQQDAEDVCQAAFLVLARKAHTIHKHQSLGSWLHGVAFRLAAKTRLQDKRRLDRQARTAATLTIVPDDDLSVRELLAILHEELEQLPAKYRTPLLLCYWEGKTRDQAADQLDMSPNVFKKRLERARKLLGSRLTERGAAPLTAFLTASLFAERGAAAVSSLSAQHIAQSAAAFAVGKTACTTISTAAALFAEGAIRAMFMTKLAATFLVFVVLSAVGVGIGVGLADVQTIQSETKTAKAVDPSPDQALPLGGGPFSPQANEDQVYAEIAINMQRRDKAENELRRNHDEIMGTRDAMRRLSPLDSSDLKASTTAFLAERTSLEIKNISVGSQLKVMMKSAVLAPNDKIMLELELEINALQRQEIDKVLEEQRQLTRRLEEFDAKLSELHDKRSRLQKLRDAYAERIAQLESHVPAKK